MEDLEIARVLLYRKANRVLAFQMLYPEVLIHIIKRFLTTGCKNKNEYEFMVVSLFERDYCNRKLLLKN